MAQPGTIAIAPEDSSALTITVNGVCLTQVAELDGTRCDYARTPPALFARMLITNWRCLRWEPANPARGTDWELSHSAASIDGGYIWPTITFASDGEDGIRIYASADHTGRNESVSYTANCECTLPAAEFERAISEFVTARELGAPAMYLRWRQVADRIGHPLEGDRARQEALPGYDRGIAPEELLDACQNAYSICGIATIREIAAGSTPGNAGRRIRQASSLIASNSAARVYVPNPEAILRSDKAVDDPWQQGIEMPHRARELWQIPPGPVSK